MAKKWTPITDEKRERIIDANSRGMAPKQIAINVEVDRDTVCRVLYAHSAKCRSAERRAAEVESRLKKAAELLDSVKGHIFALEESR